MCRDLYDAPWFGACFLPGGGGNDSYKTWFSFIIDHHYMQSWLLLLQCLETSNKVNIDINAFVFILMLDKFEIVETEKEWM